MVKKFDKTVFLKNYLGIQSQINCPDLSEKLRCNFRNVIKTLRPVSICGMSYFRREMSCKYADNMDQTSEMCSTAIFQKKIVKKCKKAHGARARPVFGRNDWEERKWKKKEKRMKESSNISPQKLKILISLEDQKI